MIFVAIFDEPGRYFIDNYKNQFNLDRVHKPPNGLEGSANPRYLYVLQNHRDYIILQMTIVIFLSLHNNWRKKSENLHTAVIDSPSSNGSLNTFFQTGPIHQILFQVFFNFPERKSLC